MEYRVFDNKVYVRLDKGDEIVSSLLSVCEREDIRVAQVQGIGGCCEATVGVFDGESCTYREKKVTALLELLSLDGNVTEYEDKPYLHVHAAFAYREGDAFCQLTGHLLNAVIGLTGEIVLTPAQGRITRRYDEELGIRVWSFED